MDQSQHKHWRLDPQCSQKKKLGTALCVYDINSAQTETGWFLGLAGQSVGLAEQASSRYSKRPCFKKCRRRHSIWPLTSTCPCPHLHICIYINPCKCFGYMITKCLFKKIYQRMLSSKLKGYQINIFINYPFYFLTCHKRSQSKTWEVVGKH